KAEKSRVVFALYIISKAGGLIYNREFHTGLKKLSSNDLLMLAGSFHGMHAITKQLCPAVPTPANPASNPAALAPSPFASRPTGLEVLETSHFRMQCFQTQTGTKFLLFSEPTQPNIDTMMRKIYELYSDYVMKNPFYTVEMPIRCEKFDRGLDGFVKVRS
ncbi:Sybindin-like protein, partial [Westerdykella ornata]